MPELFEFDMPYAVDILDNPMLQKPRGMSLPKVSEQVAVSHLDWKESQKAMLEHLSKELMTS